MTSLTMPACTSGIGNSVENINIATDGKPDMRFISWINAGQVLLQKGPHTIHFRFHSDNNNHGGLDCSFGTETEGRQPIAIGLLS